MPAKRRRAGGLVTKVILAFAWPIRLAASFTLTIYLFHGPLLVLFHGVLHFSGLICLGAISTSIVVLGCLTEHRRRELRALLMRIAQKCRPDSSTDQQAGSANAIVRALGW
jgi:hypothetical protein